MGIRELWTRATHTGVAANLAPTRARYVVLTNVVVMLAVLSSLVYLLVNLMTPGLPLYVRLSSPFLSSLFLGGLWFNARGHHWAATSWVLGVALVSQTYFTLLFGAGAGNEFFFLPILSAVFLAYPLEHRTSALVASLLGATLFLGLVALLPEWGPLLPDLPDNARGYYLTALSLVCVLTIGISFYAHRTSTAAEHELSERSEELAAALDRVREAQLQLIESERQASVGRLMAGIVHELNTPLGALRSASDTIARSLERNERFLNGGRDAQSKTRALAAIRTGKDLCGVLADSAARITQTVDAMKRFVSLDEAERKAYDVREGLETAWLLTTRASPAAAAAEFVPQLSDETPRVLCFPAKLNQVFLGVLQNAVQSGDRGLVITVRTACGPKGEVQVEIVDNGRGIAPERLATIFDVGFTQRSGRVGMRLGLPMARRHVQEIGGTIEIDSEQGVGTTVRLILPAAPRQAQA